MQFQAISISFLVLAFLSHISNADSILQRPLELWKRFANRKSFSTSLSGLQGMLSRRTLCQCKPGEALVLPMPVPVHQLVERVHHHYSQLPAAQLKSILQKLIEQEANDDHFEKLRKQSESNVKHAMKHEESLDSEMYPIHTSFKSTKIKPTVSSYSFLLTPSTPSYNRYDSSQFAPISQALHFHSADNLEDDEKADEDEDIEHVKDASMEGSFRTIQPVYRPSEESTNKPEARKRISSNDALLAMINASHRDHHFRATGQ